MDVKDKNVLVCGFARSGISASLLLKKLGANVTLQDFKQRQNLDNVEDIEKQGISLYFGKNPDKSLIDKMDIVVVSPGLDLSLDFIKYAKTKIPVISEIELAYHFCKASIVAITGTNGKTTTTSLTGEILKRYKNTYVAGNIGIPFSDSVLEAKNEDIYVLELSSFQLESIQDFKPKISCMLNITEDHLNRHKTMENYIQAKENIFKNQTDNDFIILNYDDKACYKMKDKTKAKFLFFSTEKELEQGTYLKDGIIYVNKKEFIKEENLNILGSHNMQNVMASILISLCLNVPEDIIKKALAEFKAVEHRIEYVETISGVDYYNDSKGTNTDATIKAVESMKKPTYLILGGYEKNADFRPLIKKFDKNIEKVVFIGQVKERLVDECKKMGYHNYVQEDSLEEAVTYCYKNAKEGSCVLLSPACASFDMFKDYEDRGNKFKEYVRKLKE